MEVKSKRRLSFYLPGLQYLAAVSLAPDDPLKSECNIVCQVGVQGKRALTTTAVNAQSESMLKAVFTIVGA